MKQLDLNGNSEEQTKKETVCEVDNIKIVFTGEDHWEDMELEVRTNKLYDMSFKQYTERSLSSKFTSDPRTSSYCLTSEDKIIIEDVKQYAENIRTNNKSLYYLLIYGLTIFQRENGDIIKIMRDLEKKVRHTTMINTFGMHNANDNNCKLANDKTNKFSVRMGDQLLSTVSSMAYDLKISSSTLFRVLIYYSIKDSTGFLPSGSIDYANSKIGLFESYLLETVVYYKVSSLAQSIFDDIDRNDKKSVKEFLSKL